MIWAFFSTVILLVLAFHFNVQDLFKSGWQWSNSKRTAKPKVDRHTVKVSLQGEPHALGNFSPSIPSGAKGIKFRYRVEGSFAPVEYPDKQAALTLMLQRKFDNYSARWWWKNFRQYSIPVPLEDTDGEWRELAVPLNQDHWQNVKGRDRKQGLKWTLRLLNCIAVCFGSAGGRAHGVTGHGSIEFEMRWY